jgi:hypothetical protein
MLITESQLRRHIRQRLLREGFFNKIKNIWNNREQISDQISQNTTNLLNKRGYDSFSAAFSDGPYGSANANPELKKFTHTNLTLEGFITKLFTTHIMTVEQLLIARDQVMIDGNEDNLISKFELLLQSPLITYLGLTPSALRNPVVQPRFDQLLQLVVRQAASSIKYFEAGGLPNVIQMLKPNLADQFTTLIPQILRPAY